MAILLCYSKTQLPFFFFPVKVSVKILLASSQDWASELLISGALLGHTGAAAFWCRTFEFHSFQDETTISLPYRL